MEIMTINLAANARQQYRKAGSYFEIISSNGAIGVNFSSVNGGQTDSINGGLSGLYLENDYGAFDIVEQSGIAQTVQILVCDKGEKGGSRRQPGDVKVIDNSADKTQIGKQFLGGNTVPASAGIWSIVSLGANGKTVSVKRIIISSPAAGDVSLGYFTSPGTSTPASNSAQNKLIAGPASTAKYGGNTTAGAAPTGAEVPGWTQTFKVTLSAGVPFVLDLSASPYVISGTQGLAVLDALAGNRQLSAFFDFEELN